MPKYCSKCGKEIEEQANFCKECGANTGTNEHIDKSNQKSKIAAGLLGIFLGSLGIHNFYLGYNGKAVGQLLITVLSCGALIFVSGIWGLIEGILILAGNISVDANGNELTD